MDEQELRSELQAALDAIDRIHARGPFECRSVEEAQERGRDIATVKRFLLRSDNAEVLAAESELLSVLKEALHEVEAFERRTGILQFVGWVRKARAVIGKTT